MLKAMWHGVKAFMTDRSEPGWHTVVHTQQDGYASPTRLYAYLPAIEEQRAWLEAIYRKSDRNFNSTY